MGNVGLKVDVEAKAHS